MKLSDCKFIHLSESIDLSPFDCDNADINEFLKEDAINYQKQRLANSYLLIDNAESVTAFFCLSNDCINDLGDGTSEWNRLHKKTDIPNSKRIKQYPSVKVGRLGVDKKYHRTGLAYELMDFIKGFVYKDSESACRFLLLDALNQPKQLNYYQKNGFDFLLKNDDKDLTRIMYFDLLRFQ